MSQEKPSDMQEKKSELESGEVVDTRCGCGALKCGCLQLFNSPRWFLFWACCCAFLQGLSQNGVNNVNAASYESRFQLDSTQVAWVYSSYDIVGGILLLPISYFGAYSHQPRLLGVMMAIMCVGNFVMALPHFITGLYEYSSYESSQCLLNSNYSSCSDSDDSGTGLESYQYLLMFGQALTGVSGATLYVTAFIYIDSNVSSTASPIHQAIMMLFAIVGPVFGFIMGGQFLDIYVDFERVNTTALPITPEDPTWIGAWWLGWMISGALLIPVVPAIMWYPRQMPGYEKLKRENEAYNSSATAAVEQNDNFGKSYKDMPKSLCILLKNPTFLFSSLVAIPDGMIVAGIANFLSKLIYYQFATTAALAGILSGAVIVSAAALGNLIGGILVRVFKLKVRGMLITCIIAGVIQGIASSGFLIHCPGATIAGVNTDYGTGLETIDELSLGSSCNQDCGCNTQIYQPLCGDDDKQYFNPCYAGCQSYSWDLEKYTNCSCIPDTYQAEPYSCDRGCSWEMGTFLAIMFVLACTGYITIIPSQMVSLRCVSYQQRSFSLGIKSVIGRLFGAVCGPPIYGALFDSACKVWQEVCGNRGFCWVYDHWDVGWKFAVATFSLKVIGTILYIIALVMYKPPPGGEEGEGKEEEKKKPEKENEDIKEVDQPKKDLSDHGDGVSEGMVNPSFLNERF